MNMGGNEYCPKTNTEGVIRIFIKSLVCDLGVSDLGSLARFILCLHGLRAINKNLDFELSATLTLSLI